MVPFVNVMALRPDVVWAVHNVSAIPNNHCKVTHDLVPTTIRQWHYRNQKRCLVQRINTCGVLSILRKNLTLRDGAHAILECQCGQIYNIHCLLHDT